MEILLDGALMTDRAALHDQLAEKFAFPAYYGRNLDALYDLLTAYPQQVSVALIHPKLLQDNLGRYGIAFLRTMEDAARSNSNILLSVLDEII